MDNIFFIIGISLSAIAVIVTLILFFRFGDSFLITEIQFSMLKYITIDYSILKISLEDVEKKFMDSLKQFSDSENIPIELCDELGDAAGTYNYSVNAITREFIEAKKILILNKHKDCAYLLAHELGHHILCKNGISSNEVNADECIITFANEFLTPIEREVLRTSLETFSRRKLPQDSFEVICEYLKENKDKHPKLYKFSLKKKARKVFEEGL